MTRSTTTRATPHGSTPGPDTVDGIFGLTAGATYFWQVRARNGVGTTAANNGAWWSFTTTSDVTPPTVISMTPPNGATGVSTATAVTATFSEAVDDFTVAVLPGFILLDSGNALVLANVGYNGTTRVATLTPAAPLAPATTYTATVVGVKDFAGNQMVGSVVWSFTTAAAPPSAFGKIEPAPNWVSRGCHQTLPRPDVEREHGGDQLRVLHRHGRQQRV